MDGEDVHFDSDGERCAATLFRPRSCQDSPGAPARYTEPDVRRKECGGCVGGDGLARKTKIVDVREATPGEVVVTIIKGEGKETQSPPAKAGDMVVRNRCPESGNEEFLVPSAKFAARYEGPTGPAGDGGWRETIDRKTANDDPI